MNTFQSRIHLEWCDVSGFVVSYMDKTLKGFSFQHDADEEVARTHVHSYFFGCTTMFKSYADKIPEKLGISGTENFYTSQLCSKRDRRPLDISGAWCYGSKWGTVAPKYLKNISSDEVEQLQRYARSKATIGNIARGSNTVIIKEIKVKTKPTQYEHAKTCVQRIMQTYPEVVTSDDTTQNMDKIFTVAYAYFRESQLFMGKYKQLDFLDMVLVLLNSPDYQVQLRRAFFSRHQL